MQSKILGNKLIRTQSNGRIAREINIVFDFGEKRQPKNSDKSLLDSCKLFENKLLLACFCYLHGGEYWSTRTVLLVFDIPPCPNTDQSSATIGHPPF